MPQAKELTPQHIRVDTRWFKMLAGGIEVSCPRVAAALMCRSQYWGNTGEARWTGPDREFKPAFIVQVDARFTPIEQDPDSPFHGKPVLKTIFELRGEPSDLRIRRIRFHAGELYVPDRADWRKNFTMTMNVVNENRGKAFRRLQELIAGGKI